MNGTDTTRTSPMPNQPDTEQTVLQANPMSEYEKFLFDFKVFLVILSVLTEAEIQNVRQHVEAYRRQPDSTPEHHRPTIAGPSEFLINYPQPSTQLRRLSRIVSHCQQSGSIYIVFSTITGLEVKQSYSDQCGWVVQLWF